MAKRLKRVSTQKN